MCARARDTQLCRARWSTETQHLRGVHETVAPGILSRSRRPACGPPPSPSPDTLSFALTPYPSSRLHPSRLLPSFFTHGPLLPTTTFSATSTAGASTTPTTAAALRPYGSLSLPLFLSFSLQSASSLGSTSSVADRSLLLGVYPVDTLVVHARISLILMVCLGAQRSLRDCVRGGGGCTCVSAHTTTRGERYSVSVRIARLPFQRTALHTIVHLPRRRDAGYPRRRRPARVYLHDRFHRASLRKRLRRLCILTFCLARGYRVLVQRARLTSKHRAGAWCRKNRFNFLRDPPLSLRLMLLMRLRKTGGGI